MNGAFTDQILSEKLAKLNNSQQSIETLSHWCIFHRKRAAQVVQRWEKDFKASQQPRKVPFLYLANDILQNSRRKGPEFVNEFWKALPSALQDLVENGDESTRTTVNRLISIWEDRKVFGARDQTLKEAFLGGSVPTTPAITRSNSKGKDKSPGGGTSPGRNNQDGKSGVQNIQSQLSGPLEKIAAAHAAVQELASEEESALRKCSAAINDLQALEKQSPLRIAAGPGGTAAVAEELQSKQGTLAKWTNQLEICEKKRSTLVNLLREALRTQESKLERIRSQVQIAQAQAEHAISVRHKILTSDGRPNSGSAGTQNGAATQNASVTEEHQAAAPAEAAGQDPPWPVSTPDQGNSILNPETTVESVQLGFTMEENRDQIPQSQPTHSPMLEPPSSNFQQNGFPNDVPEQERERFAGSVAPTEEEAKKKQEAAELAAKLAASSSSVAMLSSALSSLAAEGGLSLGLGLGSGRQTGGEGDFRTDKRPRLESPGGPPGMYAMGPSEGGGGQYSQPPMPTTMYMTNQPLQMMNGLPYMNYRQAAPPQRMGMPPPLPHLPPPMQPPPPPPPGFGPNYSSPFYAHQVAPPPMAPHPPSMPSPLMPRPPASV